jgi:hypothetical protein
MRFQSQIVNLKSSIHFHALLGAPQAREGLLYYFRYRFQPAVKSHLKIKETIHKAFDLGEIQRVNILIRP